MSFVCNFRKCLKINRPICQLFERAKSCNGSSNGSNEPPVPLFGDVEMGAPDPILSVRDAYERDSNPCKVNLGIGAYRDDNGEPWVLPSVEMAEKNILQKQMNKEYAPIIGIPEFYEEAAKLALGDKSKSLSAKSNATIQTLSGTGALRLGAEFLNKFWKKNREIFLPEPTWRNHPNIFEHSGLKVSTYRYYDAKTHALDFAGFVEDIAHMPKGSIILLHACAHNPTGVDPTTDQWCELSQVIKEHEHYPFFDMAYQGFATGDLSRDAFAVRLFELDGHQLCLAQSFAKNMGLYGERVGACTFVCADADEAERLVSQARILIRSLYSSPPLHGARIVAEILNDPELCQMWQQDVKLMAKRIADMRCALKVNLIKQGSKLCWDHITSHIGMFCFTGLTEQQADCLAENYSIYIIKNGRISIPGINKDNIEYVAQAFHEVTKG